MKHVNKKTPGTLIRRRDINQFKQARYEGKNLPMKKARVSQRYGQNQSSKEINTAPIGGSISSDSDTNVKKTQYLPNSLQGLQRSYLRCQKMKLLAQEEENFTADFSNLESSIFSSKVSFF